MNTIITHSVLGLLMMVAGYNVALADPVNISITGKVVASACDVDTASVSQNVDFGQVRLNEMAAAGNASDWKPFEVKLNNCPPATTSATVTFSGNPASNDATLYANSGTATGVAVQMAQAGDKSLVQGSGSQMNVAVDAQHNAIYALVGRLISSGNAVSGTFSSVVQMNFTYQ